ncbi:MAG: orotidine-5'-phosphate decarboxylase [Candidatus Omnitrophica bacterium]|nr:orotidine-5'-phosphate decarboxylase [Candidatus Omnitrophota bacterium]
MPGLKDKLIVALDVDTLEKAKYFVELLSPKVKFFKVGSQLFTACGPAIVEMIGGKGAKVFLDLKFLDIPNTVSSAVASGTASSIKIVPIPSGLEELKADEQVKKYLSFPVFMMTLHALGGIEMLKEAVKGATEKANELKRQKPYLVGVTVLTSEAANKDTSRIVLERARLAKDAGLDGVVCAATETKIIREEFGPDFIIVNPGIRAKTAKGNDQKRVMTAKEAIEAGANYIVVGRPILEAKDPLKAVDALLD